ncbi:hypothetical protein EDD17DRAFT_1616590, partial [Pisolithus thermaeus]
MRTAPPHESASRQKKDVAIKFFSDLFGLEYLKNYVGKITFFTRFSAMMETSPVSNVPSIGAAEGWSVIPCSSANDIVALEDGSRVRPPKLSCANSAMRRNLFQSGWQFTAAKSDPRLEVMLPLLNWRLETFYGMYHLASRAACVDERQRVEDEMKSILQTLGVNLLEHIRITVYNAYREHTTWPGGPIISSFRDSSCPSTEAAHRVSRVKYDRQLNIPSMVQDIMALRAKLDATKDEDEQRTLEEDATGKILWLFLCGICAEVDELLPKVVGYIQERRNMMVSGITWLVVIVIAVGRVCTNFTRLRRQQN